MQSPPPPPPPPPPRPPLPPLKGKKRQHPPPAKRAHDKNSTSSTPQQQRDKQVVIIHEEEPPVYEAANEEEFRELVQKLTGLPPDPEKIKQKQKEERQKQQEKTSVAPEPVESSSRDPLYDDYEQIKKMEKENVGTLPDVEAKDLFYPSPQFAPQDSFFPGFDTKAVLAGDSAQFPPPSPLQIAPQDNFFDMNAMLHGNSGQLPSPLITPYHSSQPNRPLSPITASAQYNLSQQIQGSLNVPSSNPSLPPMITTSQYRLPQQIQGSMISSQYSLQQQILGLPSAPSIPSLSPITPYYSSAQGVSVPFGSRRNERYNSSLEIQQSSNVPDIMNDEELDQILADFQHEPFPRLPAP
ncbi:hypothetical protein PIB30_011542 [Stylosanthes scabra]|uniref:VQ domain-containing protein n=1 Tax=Stylosanthes scabra TaxID=79078 RepID=A0ABU6T695_9FABA|nr:hypothetical protein [Stylosanthes scabra]